MSRAAEKLVSSIVAGMSRWTLHPGDQGGISRDVSEVLESLKELRSDYSVSITVHEDGSLHINDIRIPPDAPQAKKFFLKVRHKGIRKIIIGKGVREDEMKQFLVDLASSGGTIRPCDNIAVRRNRPQLEGGTSTTGLGVRDDLFHIRKMYRDIAVYRDISMTGVDAVMGRLMTNIRKGVDVGKMFLPMKGSDDDIYAHASNVALLSMFQAEHFGFGNALLHEIGLAALLHDIGKALLPRHIVNKQYELTEAEWREMKKHTVYGAALLASMNKVSEIAVVVAHEHHMKFDGTGYPEIKKRAKKQHIVSQIVAIADFFCAMSADLPHRKPLSPVMITGLLVETAGREFNPLLVDNFVGAMRAQGSLAS